MGNIAIKVDNLGKEYRIGGPQAQYKTLRDSMAGMVGSAVRFLRNPARSLRGTDTIWALKDISFEVKKGEVVGIIGRNGAGKSTLLKLLAHITEPTTGRVELHGRAGSLLEVGTGFHPELTGRENIYLNGAILGMKRIEIVRKFDEIVAFSEIEKFLDTPVKHFSSGMYVRLAFAVAAHLEPEILLVDEVLAVGDAEFQKKCLGKMENIASGGRTVLFVSHNLGSVKSLCSRVMLIKQGNIISSGDPSEVISAYLNVSETVYQEMLIGDDKPRIGTGEVLLKRIALLNEQGNPISQIYLGQPLMIELLCEVNKPVKNLLFEITISSFDGTKVTTSYSNDGNNPLYSLDPGWHKVTLNLNAFFLPDKYSVTVGIHQFPDGKTIDYIERTVGFDAIRVAENGNDYYWPTSRHGFIRPAGTWEISRDS